MKFDNRFDGHSTARAIIAYLIVIIAFGVFVMFVNYKDEIINSNRFQPFVLLTALGMGFLVALLYLVNKPSTQKSKKRKR